jgi:hypothetical protein
LYFVGTNAFALCMVEGGKASLYMRNYEKITKHKCFSPKRTNVLGTNSTFHLGL